MNDGRRNAGTAYYKSGIVPYVDNLLARKVRVVLCSNSPLDLGDEPGQFTGFNRNFDEMAGFARERNLTFVDRPQEGMHRECLPEACSACQVVYNGRKPSTRWECL